MTHFSRIKAPGQQLKGSDLSPGFFVMYSLNESQPILMKLRD